MPLPPVDLTVRMEPDVLRVVVVADVVTSTPGALGEGGMTPPSPVETYVDFAPDTMISIELWITVTFALPMGVLLRAGKLGVATAPIVGGTIPLSPVDFCVAAEKNVVNSPFSGVVDTGTKVGSNMPPPFTMILVEEPEIIVVVAPLTIVVTSSVCIVTGNAVGGCCTFVWVIVLVHDQDVA